MITLVLGGTRSGKSTIAERLAAVAAVDSKVTYLATAAPVTRREDDSNVNDNADIDFAERIATHQARRPPAWTTLECLHPGDLVTHLGRADGVVLVDSLGTWVARHDHLEADPTGLIEALRTRSSPTIVVSEEVGLAVHPPTRVGRRYVDVVGTLNQQVAAIADPVLLVVAGQVLPLGSVGLPELPPTDDA